jgi:hypothetical protein
MKMNQQRPRKSTVVPFDLAVFRRRADSTRG